MKVDRRYIDHQQQRKRLYYSDRDYPDVLQENIILKEGDKVKIILPKIANGKSNGMMILVESMVMCEMRKNDNDLY
jgi:hypothetical protein